MSPKSGLRKHKRDLPARIKDPRFQGGSKMVKSPPVYTESEVLGVVRKAMGLCYCQANSAWQGTESGLLVLHGDTGRWKGPRLPQESLAPCPLRGSEP